MGCGIHSIMQKKVDIDGQDEWLTIDTDMLCLSSSTLRGEVGDILRDNGHGKLPDDVYVDEEGRHLTYWLGDHSQGYMTLQEFVDIDLEEWNPPPLSSFTFTRRDDGYIESVTLNSEDPDYEEPWDEIEPIRILQAAFYIMYGYDLENYRLVYGMDS